MLSTNMWPRWKIFWFSYLVGKKQNKTKKHRSDGKGCRGGGGGGGGGADPPPPPETWLTVIMAFHWVSFRRNSNEKKNLIGLDLSHKDDSAQWK